MLLELPVHKDSSHIFVNNVGCVVCAKSEAAKTFTKHKNIAVKHNCLM